jgi:hypothetical protein
MSKKDKITTIIPDKTTRAINEKKKSHSDADEEEKIHPLAKENERTTDENEESIKKRGNNICARLMNETQLGQSMHKRITKQMLELRSRDQLGFLTDFLQCLLPVLLEHKVRFVRF